MVDDLDQLLESVIQATAKKNRKVVRVSTTDQLLELAKIQQSGPDPQYSNELTSEEQFYWDLYSEILDEINFYFKQSKYLLEERLPQKEVKDIEQRLTGLVELIERGPHEAKECLIKHFQLDDVDTIAAAVFCLASIEKLPSGSFYLDQTIIQFVKTEKEFLYPFIHGLKHAEHPLISKHLLTALEVPNLNFQVAILEILIYRKDFLKEPLEKFLKHRNAELRVRSAIALSTRNHQESIKILLDHIQSDMAILYERSLEACLLNHSGPGMDICREICKTTIPEPSCLNRLEILEKIASAIKLLPLFGNENDSSIFEQALFCDEQEVKVAAILSLGEFGFSKDIGRLIDLLGEENEKEVQLAIAYSLERITGAGLRMKSAEEEEMEDIEPTLSWQQWREWWYQNRNQFPEIANGQRIRWRKGKKLEFGLLIDELQAEENGYEIRKRAWQELVIRSEHNIQYEADWPIEKQQNSFQLWNEWNRKANNSLGYSI